jgi:Protein of unknown function (DUF1524)
MRTARVAATRLVTARLVTAHLATALLATALLTMLSIIFVSPGASAQPQARPGIEAADALATLDVKGRAPSTGYDRAAFGNPWTDVDGNGCDTRNDILRRDLVQKRILPDCTVARGILKDPYTRQAITHVAGRSAIDIDHVVSLSDAWQKGAFRWTDAKRTAFANDPLNLLAVDYSANRQKGDGDAATWLPPNKAFRCSFVARQVAVKAAYGLWVTAAEKSAIARVLGTCPSYPLPR